MKTLLLIFTLFLVCTLEAQTTSVPDAMFETALISLGIDSDGTVNGQVFTSDVANIEQLDVSDSFIQDLTGIQAFSALKILNISDTQLNQLDVSSNVLLEELYCSRYQDDVMTLELTTLDLSNNPNIHTIQAWNMAGWSLTSINLKNGNNNNMTSLSLDISSGTGPRPHKSEIFNGLCIQVDDENAATQNQYPYSTWNIIYTNTGYYFSENCSLSVERSVFESIQLFPNPTRDFLTIKSPNAKLEKIILYNLQGKKVNVISEKLEQIDMRAWAPGIYFVEMLSGKRRMVKKVVKE